jgi:hypothetical protein
MSIIMVDIDTMDGRAATGAVSAGEIEDTLKRAIDQDPTYNMLAGDFSPGKLWMHVWWKIIDERLAEKQYRQFVAAGIADLY